MLLAHVNHSLQRGAGHYRTRSTTHKCPCEQWRCDLGGIDAMLCDAIDYIRCSHDPKIATQRRIGQATHLTRSYHTIAAVFKKPSEARGRSGHEPSALFGGIGQARESCIAPMVRGGHHGTGDACKRDHRAQRDRYQICIRTYNRLFSAPRELWEYCHDDVALTQYGGARSSLQLLDKQ